MYEKTTETFIVKVKIIIYLDETVIILQIKIQITYNFCLCIKLLHLLFFVYYICNFLFHNKILKTKR